MEKLLIACLLFFLCLYTNAVAGEADVVNVSVKNRGNNTFDFSVTVLHKDTGWDHYANKWEIVDQNGQILGTRILHHPHVDEQPFTRSLTGVKIPNNIIKVIIRAHDLIHAYGGKTVIVELP